MNIWEKTKAKINKPPKPDAHELTQDELLEIAGMGLTDDNIEEIIDQQKLALNPLQIKKRILYALDWDGDGDVDESDLWMFLKVFSKTLLAVYSIVFLLYGGRIVLMYETGLWDWEFLQMNLVVIPGSAVYSYLQKQWQKRHNKERKTNTDLKATLKFFIQLFKNDVKHVKEAMREEFDDLQTNYKDAVREKESQERHFDRTLERTDYIHKLELIEKDIQIAGKDEIARKEIAENIRHEKEKIARDISKSSPHPPT